MTRHAQHPNAVQIGIHLIADLSGISPAALQDPVHLSDVIEGALRATGFTILSQATHPFGAPGYGVTGFFLLSESHAAYHSYPEHGYLALDIFSCGDADGQRALRLIAQELSATVRLRALDRRAAASALLTRTHD